MNRRFLISSFVPASAAMRSTTFVRSPPLFDSSVHPLTIFWGARSCVFGASCTEFKKDAPIPFQCESGAALLRPFLLNVAGPLEPSCAKDPILLSQPLAPNGVEGARLLAFPRLSR